MPRAAYVRVSVLTALTVGLALTPGTVQAGSATLPGIDVSHWNGAIDWATVADDGVRFAVMKASEGRAYTDPTYAGHLAQATANGIVAGGYHFARPDLTDGDAHAEADNYLAATALQPGTIVPVLDIEQSGGLSVPRLQDWVRRWLERVTDRTGIHPMIYSGPYFWRTYMGDTTWFADHGYDLYWIPHWGVASPDTPAKDWGGQGWRVWQWTNCWHVRGIEGCVDGDRFKGADLRRITIPRIGVSATPGGRVQSDVGAIDCGPVCEGITDPGTIVTLTAVPHARASFLGWGGACADAGASPTCVVTALGERTATAAFGYTLTVDRMGLGTGTVTSSPEGIDCGATCVQVLPYGTTVTFTASAAPTAEFAGWSGDCRGAPSVCVVTMTAPRKIGATFEDLVAPTATATTPAALGGPIRVSFSEPVHGVTPQSLILQVDGKATALPGTLLCRRSDGSVTDCALGPVTTARLDPASPLVLGQRYVATVDPAGETDPIADRVGNPVATTTVAFRVATVVDQSAPGVAFRWGTVTDDRALGHSYLMDRRSGASLTYPFNGGALTWYTAVGPGMGKARVLIDGEDAGTFDQYATAFGARVERRFTGLGAGPHTITVLVLGTHRPAATASRVVVDGFATRSGTSPNPETDGSWGIVRDARASGGSFVLAEVPGASVRLVFRGTGASWTTVTGPGMGRVAVYLDGSLRKTIDLSADGLTFGVVRGIGGLSDRLHTLRLVVLGRPGTHGVGSGVAIDGWSAT